MVEIYIILYSSSSDRTVLAPRGLLNSHAQHSFSHKVCLLVNFTSCDSLGIKVCFCFTALFRVKNTADS